MKKKLFKVTALLCAALCAPLLLAGCASSPAAQTPSAESAATGTETPATAISADTSDEQDAADFQTEIENGEITITGYVGTTTDVRIPSQIDGLPVTKIGVEAFMGKNLTSVTIPDSVTYISNWAFQNNQLTSVTLPDNIIEIGMLVFAGNQLSSITIPSSLTYMGYQAFADNPLTSVTLPIDVEDDGAFGEGVEIIRN
jgi:hypothetical protein